MFWNPPKSVFQLDNFSSLLDLPFHESNKKKQSNRSGRGFLPCPTLTCFGRISQARDHQMSREMGTISKPTFCCLPPGGARAP